MQGYRDKYSDTVGYTMPKEFGQLVKGVMDNVKASKSGGQRSLP